MGLHVKDRTLRHLTSILDSSRIDASPRAMPFGLYGDSILPSHDPDYTAGCAAAAAAAPSTTAAPTTATTSSLHSRAKSTTISTTAAATAASATEGLRLLILRLREGLNEATALVDGLMPALRHLILPLLHLLLLALRLLKKMHFSSLNKIKYEI
jgi:hypothetical protein